MKTSVTTLRAFNFCFPCRDPTEGKELTGSRMKTSANWTRDTTFKVHSGLTWSVSTLSQAGNQEHKIPLSLSSVLSACNSLLRVKFCIKISFQLKYYSSVSLAMLFSLDVNIRGNLNIDRVIFKVTCSLDVDLMGTLKDILTVVRKLLVNCRGFSCPRE